MPKLSWSTKETDAGSSSATPTGRRSPTSNTSRSREDAHRKLLTRDEAWRIAVNIARLSELLTKQD